MLKTILPAQMKALEQEYMKRTGVTPAQLMEIAATHVADAAERLRLPGRIDCFCGTGNNGGDGLAAMRILAGRNPDLQGVCWLLDGVLSPDAEKQRERLEKEAPRIAIRSAEEYLAEPFSGQPSGLIVDALFGTGLSRPLGGTAAQLCQRINRQKDEGVPVLAVDIPSGLDGAAGKILGTAVHATETVTFHRPKTGLYLNDGMDVSGRITVSDIGIREDENAPEGLLLMEKKDLGRMLPPRLHNSHKGNYGKLLVVAGSAGMAGAAGLCATAALRSGAGLVTVACPAEIMPLVQILCPCATVLPLPEDAPQAVRLIRKRLEQSDAVAAGCGLGQSEWAQNVLYGLLDEIVRKGKPAVLDADGLNLLAKTRQEYRLESCVLTPHPLEAARLLGNSTAEVLADAAACAEKLSERYGAAVVLKGAASVLKAKEGTALNVFGTPAMSKGGSGDVLTGILGALLAGRAAGAYEMNQLELLQTGCALHGLSGMAAEERFGTRGVLATDLCSEIGKID